MAVKCKQCNKVWQTAVLMTEINVIKSDKWQCCKLVLWQVAGL